MLSHTTHTVWVWVIPLNESRVYIRCVMIALQNISWLPNQMISLILIFGFLCRSSSWWPWPHIGCARLFWPLLRPQMAVLDHFFCKIYFLWVWRRKAFFWGHVGHFFGPWGGIFWDPWTVSRIWGGFPKKEGGFYALECFSNVILRDKLAVKHKDKLKTFTELFFTNGH